MDNQYNAASAATALPFSLFSRCFSSTPSAGSCASRPPLAPLSCGARPSNQSKGRKKEQKEHTKAQTKTVRVFLKHPDLLNYLLVGTEGTYKNRITRVRARARAVFPNSFSDVPISFYRKMYVPSVPSPQPRGFLSVPSVCSYLFLLFLN